ncbi:MAG TPA: HDOD domain-containing protein [Polyangiaceae bacterium]|nr:HDOD domain-containing protein [Polyangiaceae bacterium]
MVASPSHGSFGNDEDAWFGGGDDRDAEARAEQSVAAVGARIIGAKPFPVAARRLEELTRNPKARLEQVVSVLETDPGLSVRLLRLVNSAGYGLKVRVTSVRHAAVLVGTRRLHQVATTAAILDLFETNNETAVELLEHATVVGSLCRYLAVHLGLPHDELFTCGFLHDIGKLMMLDTEGEKYAELVRTYGGAPDQLHMHERRVFGFDHALLGAHVLKAWNIPEPVPKVVLYHHAPQRAMQDTLLSSMVHTLRLADMMSYALVLDSDQEGITIVTESESAQYLEISEPQVAAMWTDLRALADRSRARSHGQPDMEVVAPRRLEVPRSLRPRRSGAPRSLPPSGSLPPNSFDFAPKSSRSGTPGKSNSDVNEVPTHFPCVACSKPSYGNICAACEGQVCPEHQIGPDHWCVLCMGEYAKFRTKNALPGYVKVTGLAIAGFSVGASVTGVMVSQTFAIWKLIVAPLTMVLLWGVLLPVAHRWWMRKRFVDSRPKGRIPLPIKLPRPNPVFINSLDASLKSDGMLGPSIVPPSQTGISIISARPPGPSTERNQPSPEATAAEAKASAALLQQVHVPTESSMVAAPVVESAPAAAQEQAAPSSAVVVAASAVQPATPTAKELDAAARAFERSSEVIPATPSVPPPESIGPLRGAATSLNPPSAPPPPARPPQQTKKDTVAAHIAALLGERSESEGLSEFPSVGSESELENVVASVSARLAREFPQNDYMGPSSELRAASIAPIPERSAKPEPIVEAKREPEPVVEPKREPEPIAEAKREPEPVVEAKPEPVVEAKPEPVVEAKPESVVEAEPIAEAKAEPAVDEQAADAAPNSSGRTAPASIRLVFPRKNWEQGCAPRRVFRCALPVADSCSPAPRRVSVRPAAPEYAVSDTVPPGTLRGLG